MRIRVFPLSDHLLYPVVHSRLRFRYNAFGVDVCRAGFLKIFCIGIKRLKLLQKRVAESYMRPHYSAKLNNKNALWVNVCSE